MRIRVTCCMALSLAGLLSSVASETMAADDISKRNNLHVTRPTAPRHSDDSFSRMFPGLLPFAPPTDEARKQAQELGKKDGILDAKDNLTDPARSITEPALFSPNNPDNTCMTAGVTFFGQFLDHDLTLALKAPILEQTNPRRTEVAPVGWTV